MNQNIANDQKKPLSRRAKIAKIKKLLLPMIDEFVNNPEPGKVLDIPGFFELEHLSGLQLSMFDHRTGKIQVWQLPA
jgi:hypothetical protein